VSKFLKAMQMAARDRALLEESRRRNGDPGAAGHAAQAVSELDPAIATPEPEPERAGAEPSAPPPPREPEASRPGTAAASKPAAEYFRLRPEATGRRPEPGAPSAARQAASELEALDERFVSLLRPTSFEAEQYRALRLMIEQRRAGSGLSVVAVSSPGCADGKTTTAINLAGALAQDPGARVLLVDADLRHSSVAACFGLDAAHRAGLAEAILDPSLSLTDLAIRYPAFNLYVLTAGRPQSRPYELFASSRLGARLAEARRLYDYVVVDTPPLIPAPDSRVLANWVDGILIVVAAHGTPHRMLEEALRISDPEKVLALVFNGDDEPLASYYKGYYFAGSASSANPGTEGRARGNQNRPR
jgi:capsular exopolysaccharide synthesis family protein